MMNREKTTIVLGLVLTAILTRFIPHWPNFTAVGALALFGGAMLGFSWLSLSAVLAALFLSDLVLGFHTTMIAVYGAAALNVLVGSLALKKSTPARLLFVSLFSSFGFFLITNFAVWALDTMYSKNVSGLTQAYLMGLPFLAHQILGDLFYTAAIFSAYAFVSRFLRTA
jgi:hypothetical protein